MDILRKEGIPTGKITDWLGRIFRPPQDGLYNTANYHAEPITEQAALDAFALFAAVHLISGLLSGCEFRVYHGTDEIRGAEWASLNIKPNRNQNAAAWKRELFARLLLSGEVLCVELPDRQRIVAESFSKTEDTLHGDIFSGIQRGDVLLSRPYRITEVLYLQSPVSARQAWLRQMMAQYEKLLCSASKQFQKAGGEKGILKVSAVERGRADFEKRFAQLQNEYFRNYFEAKNAVLPLFDGYEYVRQGAGGSSGTYTNDLTAVKTLADEAVSRAAQVFGIPPGYMRGDSAGIRDAQAAMMTNCIRPLAVMLSAELTGKLYTAQEIADGCAITVDTGNILHHDLIADSAGIDKLIGGGWTLNEIRRALGQNILSDPDADVRFITKNYGTLESALTEGGEQNAG